MSSYVYVPIVGTHTFSSIPHGAALVGRQVSSDRIAVAVDGTERGFTERVRDAAARAASAPVGDTDPDPQLVLVPREELIVVGRWDGSRVGLLDAVGGAALADWLGVSNLDTALQRSAA